MNLSFSDAFRAFGATLANPQWAYSSIASDGSMVISCWAHKLKLANRVLTYTDRLSRWHLNAPGKNLLTEHLRKAHDEDLDVRLVIAKTNQPEVVERGEEAASLKKEFYIKENVVGKVTVFDGDNFVIEFRQR
jgi:hypothetical protein